jgi:hypothetical protein
MSSSTIQQAVFLGESVTDDHGVVQTEFSLYSSAPLVTFCEGVILTCLLRISHNSLVYFVDDMSPRNVTIIFFFVYEHTHTHHCLCWTSFGHFTGIYEEIWPLSGNQAPFRVAQMPSRPTFLFVYCIYERSFEFCERKRAFSNSGKKNHDKGRSYRQIN